MYKVKTLGEKQTIRYRMVYIAFATIIIIPVTALGLTAFGIDPSSAGGIISTAVATLSAIIVAHFATAPKDDGVKDD